MKKIPIELDQNLTEGEILIFRDGKLRSVEIHQLVPELEALKGSVAEAKIEIADLKQTIADLAKIIKEL